MGSALFWMRALFALLFVFITYITLTPDPEEAEAGFAVARYIASLLFGDAGLGDKVAHFSAYGALGAAAYWARAVLFGKKRWTPLLLAAYGALLEGAQGLGGVRTPDIYDALANCLGACSGFVGAYLLARAVHALRKA